MKSKSIISGTVAVLDCIISGNPRPQITWYKDTDQLTASKRIMLSDRMLVIHEFTGADIGSYTCHAKNHLGSASQSARLELSVATSVKQPTSVNTDIIAMTVVIVFTATSFIWFVVFCFCRWKRKYDRTHAIASTRADDLSSLYCQQKEDLVPELPKDFLLRCNGKVVSRTSSQQTIEPIPRLCDSAPLLSNVKVKEQNNSEQPSFIIHDTLKYFSHQERRDRSIERLAQATKDFISEDDDDENSDQHDSGVLVRYKSSGSSIGEQTLPRKNLRIPYVTIDTRDKRKRDLSSRLHKHSSSVDGTSSINNNQPNDLSKRKRLLSQSNPNTREESDRQTYLTSSSGVESGVCSSTESIPITNKLASSITADSLYISAY